MSGPRPPSTTSPTRSSPSRTSPSSVRTCARWSGSPATAGAGGRWDPPGTPRGMSASVSMPRGSVRGGSYDSYERAQAAVDYLAGQKFAVENGTIIGSELRQVERVSGRLTWGRVLAAGAAGGAWWGLFVEIGRAHV